MAQTFVVVADQGALQRMRDMDVTARDTTDVLSVRDCEQVPPLRPNAAKTAIFLKQTNNATSARMPKLKRHT